MEKDWDIVIKPKSKWFNVHIKEVLKYSYLTSLFVKRNFTAQYKQTILGPLWAIIQPLLTTLMFTVVFGNIAKLPTDSMPPFLFYMAGNIVWSYFSSCLTSTSTTFLSNRHLLSKIYFPRLVIPVSVVITQFISFLIQFLFFICFLLYYGFKGNFIVPNLWILLTPFLFIETALLALGCGIIVSALTTRYRDLAMLVNFGVQLWMYATPIAYATSLIPQKYFNIYMLNPMSPIIETFRYAFLGSGTVHPYYLLIGFFEICIIFIIGIILFSHVEKTFMDTI